MNFINDRIFRRRISFLVAVILVAIVLVLSGSSIASAKGTVAPERHKYFKNIVIENGDSLWSIAQEYISDEYDSTEEYIDELMNMNNLKNDKIHSGNNLVIAYYSENPVE